MSGVAYSKAFQKSLFHPTVNLKDSLDVLDFLFACVTNSDVSRYHSFCKVLIRHGLYLIVCYMHQWTHPQLHLTEDTRESPHVLTLQITTVAPAIHLDGEFVLSLANVFRYIKLSGRHGVLTIAHLLPIYPHIEGRMNTAEVED